MVHPKAALIERLQREGRGQPQFKTEREGPEHEPVFRARVSIQGKHYGEGSGSNKREAERRAAEMALLRLDADANHASAPSKTGAESRNKRRRKGGGNTTAAAIPEFEDEPLPLYAAPFAGPWPLYPDLLVESLRIAHARVDAELRGDVALAGIEAFALRLYKDVLEDLGEVVAASTADDAD